MDKLATIQRIESLTPIPKADAIETAKVLGWDVVVKKGEYKVGDLCVYVEIDSVLSRRPEFMFMKPRHFRVRTIRLRKQLSQGMCFPLSILDPKNRRKDITYDVGDVVTKTLGIKKWKVNLPKEMIGKAKGNFPTYISKTDETRVQSAPSLLQHLTGKSFYITLKIDGTSATFARKDNNYEVCSRNLSLTDSDNLYWRMSRKYNIDKILEQEGNFVIQGEIAGPSIQKNRLELKEEELFVFNIFDVDNNTYLSHVDMCSFCSKYNLQIVPTVIAGGCFNYSLKSLLELAKGKYVGTKNHREGIVIRSAVHDSGRRMLSFKVINNDFLLKE